MPINLKTVITELQFIQELVIDNPTDSRLAKLLGDAKLDLATATRTITGGTDPIIDT